MHLPISASLSLLGSLLLLLSVTDIHAQDAPPAPQSSDAPFAYSYKPVILPFTPPPSATWVSEHDFSMNDAGEIAYIAEWETGVGYDRDEAICTSKYVIARTGDVIGGKKVLWLIDSQLNNAGQVGYIGLLPHPAGQPPGNAYQAVFVNKTFRFQLPTYAEPGDGGIIFPDNGQIFYAEPSVPDILGSGKKDDVITTDGIHWRNWKILPAGITTPDDMWVPGYPLNGGHIHPSPVAGIHTDSFEDILGPAGLLIRARPNFQTTFTIPPPTKIPGVTVSNGRGQFFIANGVGAAQQSGVASTGLADANVVGYIATPIGQAPASAPNSFKLTKATTTDAQSVTVDYSLPQDAPQSAIDFKVFRCSKAPTVTDTPLTPSADVVQIGPDVHDPPAKTLSDGQQEATLLSGTPLTPDTSKEFVVVQATCNGVTSTSYFRKWMLGAISHGFDRYASEVFSHIPLRHWQSFDLPEWETKMAKELQDKDKFDYVIPFDWMHTCAVEQRGLSQEAGYDLEGTILLWITAHQHNGDVVDLHLFGHSRGAVVVTQALERLAVRDPKFGGGWIEVTLLDPHPANDFYCDNGITYKQNACEWGSFGVGETPSICYGQTYQFQAVVKDPPIALPKGTRRVDIWYQHTKAAQLTDAPDDEDWMNLWGIVTEKAIPNDYNVPISLRNLTSDPEATGTNAIGHNQVPSVYEAVEVDSGTLDRTAIPTGQ